MSKHRTIPMIDGGLENDKIQLRAILAEVHRQYPELERLTRNARVHRTGRDRWHFQYGEYAWEGPATNAYTARTRAWTAYLQHEWDHRKAARWPEEVF